MTDFDKEDSGVLTTAEVAKEKHTWFVFSFISLVTLVVVGLFYFVYRQRSPHFGAFFMWYASLVAIVAIWAAKYKQACRLISIANETIGKQMERDEATVFDILKKEVFPRVSLCDSLDEVYEMAAEVIRKAHEQKHPELRYVTFYGAAALATPDVDYEEFGISGLGQQTPYQHYLGAMEAATGEKIRIRRYIRLFTPREFSERSAAVQRDYVNWLKAQYDMLSRNPNYLLADVVRAPHWGANLARIMTHNSMMELTGDGAGAVVITDEHLCDTVRRYARAAILGGKDVHKKPEYFGKARECGKDKVHEFWKYLHDLEESIETSASGDEESDS